MIIRKPSCDGEDDPADMYMIEEIMGVGKYFILFGIDYLLFITID